MENGATDGRRTAHPPRGERLGLGYLYGGVVIYQPGERLAPRTLTDYELVLILDGRVTYTSDERAHTLPPGGMVLGRPGFREAYRWDPHQKTRHAYVHFAITRIPADWPAPSQWPRVRPEPSAVVAGLFRHLMQHVYEHPRWPAEPPGPHDCRLVEVLIDSFLELAHGDGAAAAEERPEAVRRALKWMRQTIDENPGRRVELAEVARVANVTEKHLCRLFAKALGHAPMRTFALLRLQLALALLARSNLNVGEIAQRCGYDNPLYFSRLFAKIYGAPPTRVRAALLRGGPPPPNLLPADITPRVYW